MPRKTFVIYAKLLFKARKREAIKAKFDSILKFILKQEP